LVANALGEKMDAITMVKEHRSVRKFKHEKVDRNTMKNVKIHRRSFR